MSTETGIAAILGFEKTANKDIPNGYAGLNADSKVSDSIPSGSVWGFAGATAPMGWILCDGTAISRTTYAALFAIIGTTYGIGDGSTTFNIPNLKGRVVLGAGAGAGLTERTRGQIGGEETHQLTIPEMPAHAHTYNELTGAGDTWEFFNNGSVSPSNTGSAGGDGVHNNMQPFCVLNYIIKL